MRALPVFLQRVDADRTRYGVNVGVVDFGEEVDCGWDIWKIRTGGDAQQKVLPSVGSVGGPFQFDLAVIKE